MRKKIGIIAAVTAVLDLFVYLILIVTGNAFTNLAFTGFVFFMWFACLAVAVPCLFGEVIKFIGKQFSAGYNSPAPTQSTASVFCSKCGKAIDATVTFCPHCGEKRN